MRIKRSYSWENQPVRLLTLIPARNEADSLPEVVSELRSCPLVGEILVVDDASRDMTPEVLSELGVSWLRLGDHLGLGNALRAGLRAATRSGFDHVLRFDGDGQHRAAEIPAVLAALGSTGVDAVVGSRYLDSGDANGYHTPGLRRVGQRVLARSLSILTGRSVSDPTSGLWAFGPRAVELLAEHHPTGYPEPELHLFLKGNGIELAEVPIRMRPRRAGRTSLTPRRELVALMRVLLALVVVPLRPPERAGGAS